MAYHIIFKFLPLCFLALITLSSWSNTAYALDVLQIRFGEHPDKIRTVIELNENTDYKIFTLPASTNGPYRISIDLPEFNWKTAPIKHLKSGIIQDVRTGNVRPGIMRIVFDLTKPMIIQNAFILPASHNENTRLVFDSVIVTAQEYAKAGNNSFGSLLSGPTQTAQSLKDLINQHSPIENDAVSETIIVPKKKPYKAAAEPTKTASPLRRPLIVIDAGHGGADPGAVGDRSLKEKHITLSAAKELKSKLEQTGRYRVSLTRADDRYLKLHKRVSIARDKEADLFISLHADSIDKSNVRGASIYTLSNKASDQQTARLAARENQVDLIAGVDLSHEDKEVANILIDLAMRDTMNQSKFFANTVVKNMIARDMRVLPRTHRYAGFAVLKAPDIPSVLFEMGFMSNRNEARLLATHSYQEKIALVLTQSIDEYFSKVQANNHN